MKLSTAWYALRVKSRQERVAEEHLRVRGAEPYAPTYETKRRWSDRIKTLELPLFPGYIFCRFRHEQKLDVLSAPGVTSLVAFGNEAAPVSEQEIAAIKTIVSSGLPYGPWPYIKVGDRVRIERGCMEGVEGTLVRVRDEMRVVVNVELLQRAVAVEIDRVLVTKAS